MAEKLPITDGTWWHAKSAVWVRCLICDRLHKTRPAVLRYIPEHDFSKDWNKKYPGIEKTGWLHWGTCRKRERDYFEPVSESAIKRWDTQVTGWRNRSRSAGGFLP